MREPAARPMAAASSFRGIPPPVFGYFEETEGGYNQLKAHPLPWLVEILNGVEHANFFEQRATEYSKAASKGSWDGDDGVWATFGKAQV